MRRALALLVSVGLVLGAVALRAYVIDGDDRPGTSPGQPLRLVCSPELADECHQLADDGAPVEVAVRDPGEVSNGLLSLTAGEDVGFDAWLTVGPWAPITDDTRNHTGADTLFASPVTLATSDAVLVTIDAAADQLGDCAPDPTWRCVGSLQGSTPRIGMPSPERGDGLVLLAAATASYFDGEPYSAADFGDPGFATWVRRLTDLSSKQPTSRRTPLETALSTAGAFGVTGALGVELPAGEQADRITVSGGSDAEVLAPVQLVAPSDTTEGDGATQAALDTIGGERLRRTLGDAGWDPVEGDQPPPTGLPSAGVLQRLREQWPNT